ncbi:MAG: hypothetical protein OCU18_09040, partial [Candidatus Syntrophoarchaeum sp.]|nr:hypothetical protein [Candidatus Syntrophoarchaeum sp.]
LLISFPNIIIIKSLIDYFLNEEYAKVERLGARLAQIDPLINWDAFSMRRKARLIYPCPTCGRTGPTENRTFCLS